MRLFDFFYRIILYRVFYVLKKNNETHANRVYNFLKKRNKPLSAYEILEELASQGITAPTTIYRALNKLVSNGLIHKIESLNAWTVCCGNHDNKIPIFEICKSCGNVTEHLDINIANSIKSLSKKTGFLADNPIFEIHGQCNNCILN